VALTGGEMTAETETGTRRGAASLRTKIVARLPLAVWLLVVTLSSIELWMILVTLDRPTPGLWGLRGWELLSLAFGSVGALLSARQPGNRIGWLLLSIGLATACTGIVNQYPILTDATGRSLPLADAARWTSAWIWVLLAFGLMLLPLLFPDGHLLTSRWRAAFLLALVATGTLIGSIIIAVQPIGPMPASPLVAMVGDQTSPLMMAGFVLYVSSALAAAASVVVRYRRAATEQRQQIKWFAFAGTLFVPGAIAGLSPILLGQVFLLACAFFAVVAIAVAVLRYRLYEIDLIINRTLVYGALSAMLAGIYTASITLSQRIFTAVTGERSDAAIVLTTLIVVSLFTPLKTRLQEIVDRRLKLAQPSALASAPASALDVLVRLDELRAGGVISAADYETAKSSLLAQAVGSPAK
jgi:hypothetical protein